VVETTRRQEIEDVASSLFHEHGYSGTSVRDIARALDIQGASLYAHVASKQDVLWSIVDGTASRFEAAAAAAAEAVTPTPDAESTPPPADRLAALVRAHVGIVTDDIERASVFIHEWRSLSTERRAEIARRRDAYEQRFREVIADGVGERAFAPVDPVAAAAYLLTALNGLVAWYRPDRRLNPAALADAYVQLSLQALDAGRHAEVPV
jgi:AcrR family transcriptional regulator